MCHFVYGSDHQSNPIEASVHTDVSGLPLVEISTSAPFRIRNASQEWLDLFQFSREEVSGRSLRLVSGPATSMVDLNKIIDTARFGKEAQAALTFYSSSGKSKTIVVKSLPSQSGDEMTCSLMMLLSDAISLKEAPMDSTAARVVVSCDSPHLVEFVNPRFATDFGLSADIVTGKSLRIIQGPGTDTSSLMQMVRDAKGGFARSGSLNLYTSDCRKLDCEVSFLPLLGHSGIISHLMAVIEPANHHGIECMDIAMEVNQEQMTPSNFHHGQTESFCQDPEFTFSATLPATNFYEAPLQTITESQVPASSFDLAPSVADQLSAFDPCINSLGQLNLANDSSSELGEISSRSSPEPGLKTSDDGKTLILVPRRKRDSSKTVGALELTAAKLQELGKVSMKQAAFELGIASSTLKKACRKLGVDKWPHGSQGGNKSKAMDYDGSYVRRLFAKYSKNGKGGECGPSHEFGSPSNSDACSPQEDAIPQAMPDQFFSNEWNTAPSFHFDTFPSGSVHDTHMDCAFHSNEASGFFFPGDTRVEVGY
mmetsp:Transcript_61050/g.125964  ORF Transcript_61050/g.125964 Transcript_61050/m.125964 type:complete len:539 (+) Transcript_61050:61-1677(+)|eukprot:CAMPEP_0181316000 /NCGR_PEP_ID=MMETSP1101-20121128/15665_1 /TAXON_ID=46948 /ORGANISM="Rhodomonas abbreviata, Strain Caron Lab Isolate" /LENGTH=538 /DNA_ID=CAMNT_0023423225 /DNA_START=61 /DNA_END=1677 /DNA_ORIENTATION=+